MRLTQPDPRSCGAACLVMARRLRDPSYAAHTREPTAFRTAVLAAHRAITRTSFVSPGWPRAIGTPPWTMRRELAAMTGSAYATQLIRIADDLGWSALGAATPQRPVAAYVGSAWLPRHVVLVVDSDDDSAHVYEPSSGLLHEVSRTAWLDGTAPLGWPCRWLAITPVGRTHR